MAKVTSTYNGKLRLPGSTAVLRKGVASEVENWDRIRNNGVVKGWLKAGVITVDGSKAQKADDAGSGANSGGGTGDDAGNDGGGAGNDTNENETQPLKGPLTAKDTGSGWWTLYDGEGTEIGKKVRKAEGEAFNAMDDEAKLTFLNEQS